MARRPTRKVTYFEPVAPRLARNTIIALPLEDVDFENRLLIVRQGKGKKDRGYTLKSGSRCLAIGVHLNSLSGAGIPGQKCHFENSLAAIFLTHNFNNKPLALCAKMVKISDWGIGPCPQRTA
jgi:hypothetical protein